MMKVRAARVPTPFRGSRGHPVWLEREDGIAHTGQRVPADDPR